MNDIMAEAARWLSNPIVLCGLLALCGGALLVVLSVTFTNNYESGGHRPVHRIPDKPEDRMPWMRDYTGTRLRVPQHRFAGTPGESTRKLAPTTTTGRARVSTTEPEGETHPGEPAEVHFPLPPARVRIDEEEPQNEEEPEEKRDQDGKEGGAKEKEPQTLRPATLADLESLSWYYIPSTDRYVLAYPDYRIVYTLDAEAYEQDQGRVTLELFRHGFPMLPPNVPFFTPPSAPLRSLYR